MIKKIVVMLGLVFMLVPLSNVFAASSYPISGTTSYVIPLRTSLQVGDKIYVSWSSDRGDYNMSRISVNGDSSSNSSYRTDITMDETWTVTQSMVDFSPSQIKITPAYAGNYPKTIYTVRLNGKTMYDELPPITYTEIKNLTYTLTGMKPTLRWTAPSGDTNYAGAKIYKDGTLLKQVSTSTTFYQDIDLEYDKSYSYKVTAVYLDGKETAGVTTTILIPTPKPVSDVTKLNATPSWDRVDLSWVLPEEKEFKHVNIYRETLSEETEKTSMLESIIFGSKAYAAESKKIFETNGTHFNDLTVTSETTYEYTLTTIATNGLESEGVSARVTTGIEPPPVIVGGGLEKTEDGDYKYSWDEPTTGKVIIKVGDKEYEVDAEDSEFIIPKEDMEYNPIGDPDVSATPESESGKKGTVTRPPSKLSEIELPFGVGDLLKTGSGLLWWIAPFVLLGLSFLLVPKLRNLIVYAVKGEQRKETDETGRRTKADLPETEKRERVEKEPKEIKKEPIEKQGKKLRSVKVRERQIKEPKEKRERTVKVPKVSRGSRESRQPRQAANRAREVREGRQSERVQRMPREPKQGR